MLAVTLAGAAAATFGVADFLGGTAARRLPSAVVAVLAQCAGLAFALVAVLTVLDAPPLAGALAWGTVAGLAGGLGIPVLYRGLARGPMSVVPPLTALTSAAVPVLAGALRGERPSTLAWFGIGLAVLAGAVVGGVGPGGVGPGGVGPIPAGGRAEVWGGVGLALFAGLYFGGFFVLISRADPAAGLWPVAAAKASGVVVAALALLLARRPGARAASRPPRSAPAARRTRTGFAPRTPTRTAPMIRPGSNRGTRRHREPQSHLRLRPRSHRGPRPRRRLRPGPHRGPRPRRGPRPGPRYGRGPTAMGRTLRLALLGGALDALANALYLLAAQRGQLAVVGAVVALYPVTTVVLARVVHREPIGARQRFGLALAVPALVLAGAG